MSTINLKDQKRHLESLKTDAQSRIERFNSHLRHESGPVPQDFADQATEVENDETIAALFEATKYECSMIEAAIARIEDGSYGKCTDCGNAISTERLAALPTATLCIDCASDS